jgi:hypothetical protein
MFDRKLSRKGHKPCSYKDFMACKPTEFKGTEEPVGLLHWLDDLESKFEVTNTQEADKVLFGASTLKEDAQAWWKAYKDSVGSANANAIPWDEFKEMVRDQYCSEAQQQELEREFWHLRVKNDDIDAYCLRFNQLCSLCPGAVVTEKRRISRFVYRLPGSIQATVTGARWTRVGDAMRMAKDLMIQVKRRNTWRSEDKEKKSDNK